MATINPYDIIGTQHANALADLETSLETNMTLAQVNTIVTDFISNLYFPESDDLFLAQEFKTIIPVAANEYINSSGMGAYNGIQNELIDLLCKSIICEIPTNSIRDFILDVEDNITKSGLTVEEQIPLLMAASVGKNSYSYWLERVIETEPSNWITCNYLNNQNYINYAKIPYIVAASMLATLAGANKSKSYGLLDPPKMIGVDMVSALTSGVGAAAGVVMFKWIPRIQPEAKGGFRL